MRTALTIAGSDSSGGAGIQADIKTMTMNGVFAMSAITALTAQNTTGVTGILNSTPEFLAQQLDAVFTDIYPDAVKIGMVSSQELIRVIAQKLRQYGAKHIVVDPVMVATSGAAPAVSRQSPQFRAEGQPWMAQPPRKPPRRHSLSKKASTKRETKIFLKKPRNPRDKRKTALVPSLVQKILFSP